MAVGPFLRRVDAGEGAGTSAPGGSGA
jgi:hypothetical protein